MEGLALGERIIRNFLKWVGFLKFWGALFFPFIRKGRIGSKTDSYFLGEDGEFKDWRVTFSPFGHSLWIPRRGAEPI